MCPLGENSTVRNSCLTLFWNLLPFLITIFHFFLIQPFTISFISAQSDRWSSRERDLWKTFQETMLQNLRNSYRSSSEGHFWGKNWIFCALIHRGHYTVARRYEFYFRVARQYFTNERSEWVKYCFCHEKIKFISSSRRVMFFLLYRQKDR